MTQPVVPPPAAPPPPPPEPVLVRSATGEVGTVAARDVGQLLESGGQVVSPEQLEEERLAREYGGGRGQAIAGGLALARGLTMYGSDIAAAKLGPEGTGEEIQRYEKYNPITSGIGEVAGMLAPTVLTGGGSLGARAAIRGVGFLPRLAARAGLATEGAIGRAIGTGAENLIARAAQRGVGMAGQVGVESALQGIGHQLSEDALGNHEVTGEKLLGAVKRDFISGAEIGGALGAGGAVLGRLAGKLVEKGVDAVDAEKLASMYAYKATGGKTWDLRRFAKPGTNLDELAEDIGRVARKEKIITEDTIDKFDMVKQAQAVKKRNLADLDDMHASLAKRGQNADMTTVWKKGDQILDEMSYMKQVTDKNGKISLVRTARPGLEEEFNAVSKWLDEAKAYATSDAAAPGVTSFKKMHDTRVLLDNELQGYWQHQQAPASKAEKHLVQLRGVLEDEFERQSSLAMKSLDPAFADKYAAAKNIHQRVMQLEQILHRESARDLANQTFSIKDLMGSNIGASVGGSVGSLGGPMGFAAGSIAGGLTGAFVNKFMRQRGPQIASGILGRAADLRNLANTTSGLTRAIEGAVDNFMSGKVAYKAATVGQAIKGAPERKDPKKEDFLRIAKRITDLKANPQAIAEQTAALVPEGIHKVAPKSVAAMQQGVQNKVNYLADKLPKVAPGSNYFQLGLGSPRLPSDTSIAKFYEYLKGAEDAYAIVEASRKGQLTREIVDASKKLHPNVFEMIQKHFMKALSTKKNKMTQQQRTAMSILFDMPADATHEPDFIKTVQEMYAAQATPEPGEGGQTPLAPKRGINISGSYETAAQQLEEL